MAWTFVMGFYAPQWALWPLLGWRSFLLPNTLPLTVTLLWFWIVCAGRYLFSMLTCACTPHWHMLNLCWSAALLHALSAAAVSALGIWVHCVGAEASSALL